MSEARDHALPDEVVERFDTDVIGIAEEHPCCLPRWDSTQLRNDYLNHEPAARLQVREGRLEDGHLIESVFIPVTATAVLSGAAKTGRTESGPTTSTAAMLKAPALRTART